MKIKLAFGLLVLAVSMNLHAETSTLPAPLPEFMDDAQAAKWSSSKAGTTQSRSTEPSAQFYTGKPYVADVGGYIFKYRTYNPEMSRWTSADPSGFPDGVNNRVYAPIPTKDLDSDGLLSMSGVENPNLSTTPVQYNGGTYTIASTAAQQIGWSLFPGSTFSGTTFTSIYASGYTLTGAYSPAAISINTYTVADNGDTRGGAILTLSVTGEPSLPSGWNYAWIQIITSNVDPQSNNQLTSPITFTDKPTGQASPFYPTNTGVYFYDFPKVSYANVNSAQPNDPITWNASLFLVAYSGTSIDVYGGLTWNYQISE